MDLAHHLLEAHLRKEARANFVGGERLDLHMRHPLLLEVAERVFHQHLAKPLSFDSGTHGNVRNTAKSTLMIHACGDIAEDRTRIIFCDEDARWIDAYVVVDIPGFPRRPVVPEPAELLLDIVFDRNPAEDINRDPFQLVGVLRAPWPNGRAVSH